MNTVKLGTYDHEPLKKDLKRLEGRTLTPPGTGKAYDGTWEGVSLVNSGGVALTARADRPTLEPHRPTPLLDEVPAIRALLESIPAPIRCARLMTLRPFGRISEHTDPWHSFPSGLVRLHVPIVAPAGATSTIGGELVRWNEGELWFGDFRKVHQVYNESEVTRVNLIIDVELTPALLQRFPSDFVAEKRAHGIAFARPPLDMTAEQLASFCCDFDFPPELPKRTSLGVKATRGGVARDDRGLVLSFDDRKVARLECVAPDALHVLGTPPGWVFKFTFMGDRPGLLFFERPDMDYAANARVLDEWMLPLRA